MINGALPVIADNADFGKLAFMLQSGKAVHMGNDWETRRRREPGHDWAILKLAASGLIDRFLVDTNHFEGNFPDRCSIQGAAQNADLDGTEHWPRCYRSRSSRPTMSMSSKKRSCRMRRCTICGSTSCPTAASPGCGPSAGSADQR